MEKDRASELMESARSILLRMNAAIAEKDVDKMAICFYDLIKQTYGLAKGQDVYEDEKENIDDTLKGMLVLMKAMSMVGGWTEEMVEEFDEKVINLWAID